MTPYHYSIVQCRDLAYKGERRNVGLLVLSPALGKAWLRRANLKQRAHLIGDDAAFVRALLDLLQEEASRVAREGSAAAVHGWLRARARPSDDALVLGPPAMGIAEDLAAEVRRLRPIYLGRAAGPRQSPAEALRENVLRTHHLRETFRPRAFTSGPATWRFPAVAEVGRGPVVFNALAFSQRTPEGLLDAAFHTVGRAQEVRAHHDDVRWLTVATGPGGGDTGRAFARACELMRHAGLNLVQPDERRVVAALSRLGLLAPDGAAAQA